jgi:hypothetical protein
MPARCQPSMNLSTKPPAFFPATFRGRKVIPQPSSSARDASECWGRADSSGSDSARRNPRYRAGHELIHFLQRDRIRVSGCGQCHTVADDIEQLEAESVAVALLEVELRPVVVGPAAVCCTPADCPRRCCRRGGGRRPAVTPVGNGWRVVWCQTESGGLLLYGKYCSRLLPWLPTYRARATMFAPISFSSVKFHVCRRDVGSFCAK